MEIERDLGDTGPVEPALLKVVPSRSYEELAGLKEPRLVTEIPGPWP